MSLPDCAVPSTLADVSMGFLYPVCSDLKIGSNVKGRPIVHIRPHIRSKEDSVFKKRKLIKHGEEGKVPAIAFILEQQPARQSQEREGPTCNPTRTRIRINLVIVVFTRLRRDLYDSTTRLADYQLDRQ